MSRRGVAILGSTGSIGTTALQVLRRLARAADARFRSGVSGDGAACCAPASHAPDGD